MNLQSEIDYFAELPATGQARLLALVLHELSSAARSTYGAGPDQVQDGARLRFVNELTSRLARYIEQVLGDEPERPGVEVLMRMLLSPRADKVSEKMIHSAYRRALQNFERYDTTVFMNKQ